MDAQRLLDTFLDLVRIDSESQHEAGVAEYAMRALADAGASVHADGSAPATGSDTGNVIAVLPGTLPGRIFVAAHMDTMHPGRGVSPRIEDGTIVTDGKTVLGGDDKVGVAAGIEAVRHFAQSDAPHPTVGVVFTVQEEVGLLGSRALEDGAVDGSVVLVCDEDGAPGTVYIAAPFHYTFTAVFNGRAAHAAVAPEKGISAIAMAADAIAHMQLGQVGGGVCNVGTINGGSATNVVAPSCTVTGECRSLDGGCAASIRDSLQAAMAEAAQRAGGTVEVEWTLEYGGFSYAEDGPEAGIVRSAAASLGLPFEARRSLGGTDANVLAGKGAHCLMLGTGMTDFHTTRESLKVKDLEDTARMAIAIIDAYPGSGL